MLRRTNLLSDYISRLRYSPEKLQPHLADLDASRLVETVRTQFYNPVVMEMALVILFAISIASTSKIPVEERIRHWFGDLEQIGSESVEGYAMRSDLGPVANTFILKAPRDPANGGLIHEMTVGLYGTNRLRALIPNFAYIFGGFRCSQPIIQPRARIDNGKVVRRDVVDVVSYCQSKADDQVPYVIYENIAPAVEIDSFVRTCSSAEFIDVWIQLVLALRLAYLSIGLVHNDLHSGNVLIRRLDQPMSFPYPTPSGRRYLTTRVVVTIIDLGRARFTYEGHSYGYDGLESVGVFQDVPLPYLDVYKIFYFCLYAMVESKNPAYTVIRGLVPFFDPSIQLDDPQVDSKIQTSLIDGRSNVFYPFVIPQSSDQRRFLQSVASPDTPMPIQWKQAITFTYDAIIAWTLDRFAIPSMTSSPITTIGSCRRNITSGSSSSCGKSSDILRSFFDHPLDRTPHPDDLFELYDLVTNRLAKPAVRDRLIDQFRSIYPSSRDQYQLEIQTHLDEIDTGLIQDRIVSLTGSTQASIRRFAGSYRDYVVAIARLVSILSQVKFDLVIGQNVASMYRDGILLTALDDMQGQASNLRDRVSTRLRDLAADAVWVSRIKIPRSYIQGDPNLSWIVTDLSGIVEDLIAQVDE